MARTTAPVFLSNIKALYKKGSGSWIQLYALGCEVTDKKNTEEIKPSGHRGATGIGYGKEWSEITLQGQATYGELGAFCEDVANTPSAPASFSIFYGTAAGGYQYDDCVVTGWTIEQTETAVNLTVNLVGKKGYQASIPGTIGTTPAANKVLLRGRNTLTAAGIPDTTVGTMVKLDTEEVEDWYTWSVQVENLAQNGYWGYAITPSFTGAGVVNASFGLNWDADPDNVADSNRYTKGTWEIKNKTEADGTIYTTTLSFEAQCIEAQGYADEQELVRSYQSSHTIIEGATNIVTIAQSATPASNPVQS